MLASANVAASALRVINLGPLVKLTWLRSANDTLAAALKVMVPGAVKFITAYFVIGPTAVALSGPSLAPVAFFAEDVVVIDVLVRKVRLAPVFTVIDAPLGSISSVPFARVRLAPFPAVTLVIAGMLTCVPLV